MENQSFWSGSSKSMFFMGLFLGLAISSMVALAVVMGMIWNGKSLGSPSVAQAPAAPLPSDQNGNQPPAAPARPVKEVSDVDHIRGNKNAKVTLIEYSDFECPFCKRHTPTVDQALKDFPKDVRVVYRHYPLTSIHQNAQKAAEASECAAKIGGNDAFWKMHDKIFAAATLSLDGFVNMAKEIGVNEGNFKNCLNGGETANRVNDDIASGNDSGVEGTPATFVNGKLISGAIPYASLKAEIQGAGGKE